MTPWTPQEDEFLRSEWTAGTSGAAIAKQMRSRSRNAVIGRVYRLGLGIETPHRKNQHAPRPRQKYYRKPPKFRLPEPMPVVAPDGSKVMLFEALPRFGRCRYILPRNDGETIFVCGETTKAESSWCSYHETIVFRPVGVAS